MGIKTITSLINQSANQNTRLAVPKMHVHQHGETFSKVSQETLIDIAPGDKATEKVSSMIPSPHNTTGDNTTPFKTRSRPYDFQTRDCTVGRQISLTTPMVGVSVQSRTSNVRTIRSSEVDETLESDVTFVIYPKATGRFIGITRGMLISAKSTAGWQYSIQTFRAVPETALIFDFCREGNLDGVKSLFKRGEASPWDRDPRGQTPLLV